MMLCGCRILTGALLLVAIASVDCQTELRIEGPVNNVTLNTNKQVNIIVCDAPSPSKMIGTTKMKQKPKPSSSSRSRSSRPGFSGTVDCPEDEGFFRAQWSNQCFKAFIHPDHEVFWGVADKICKANGLVLAKPTQPVPLRQHLYNEYGDHSYWIGARGDGMNMRWQRDNQILDLENSAWQDGIDEDYLTSDMCLGFSANSYMLGEYPTQPYWSWGCATRFTKYPLCERI